MCFSMDLSHCALCPRRCGADRRQNPGGRPGQGFCGAPATPRLARAALHHWEEPCLSGAADDTTHGSGTVFFSHCNLGCCFCQNAAISAEGFGKNVSTQRLGEIFLQLQQAGAYNLNLVSATPYLPFVLQALQAVRGQLQIPVVYNTGGYECPEALQALAPYVDIWLTDLKFCDSALSARLCGAADYFAVAAAAAKQMVTLAGPPVWDANGLLRRGVIVRHLVLPGQRADSKAVLDFLAKALPKDRFLLSLMSQYTPCHRAKKMPGLGRRVSSYEYNDVLDCALALGLENGYMQQRTSAKEEYTPPFDLSGV